MARKCSHHAICCNDTLHWTSRKMTRTWLIQRMISSTNQLTDACTSSVWLDGVCVCVWSLWLQVFYDLHYFGGGGYLWNASISKYVGGVQLVHGVFHLLDSPQGGRRSCVLDTTATRPIQHWWYELTTSGVALKTQRPPTSLRLFHRHNKTNKAVSGQIW